MNKKIHSLFALLLLCLVSCSGDQDLGAEAYMNWIKDRSHGLIQDQQFGGLKYSIFYKPLDFHTVDYTGKTDEATFAQAKKQYEGLEYVNLRIAVQGSPGSALKYALSSEAQYNERIDYLSFFVKEDLKLLCGADTLHCRLSHFSRNYDLTPYIELALGFDAAPDCREDRTLLFQDHLFNQGLIQFTVDQDKLAALPTLNLKK